MKVDRRARLRLVLGVLSLLHVRMRGHSRSGTVARLSKIGAEARRRYRGSARGTAHRLSSGSRWRPEVGVSRRRRWLCSWQSVILNILLMFGRGWSLRRHNLGARDLRQRHELLCPLQRSLWENPCTGHSGEYQRNHGRRDASRERGTQHVHLNLALFETQALLPRALLFLPPLIVLGPRL